MSTDASLRSQLESVRHRLSWMENRVIAEGQERRKDALLIELDAVLATVAEQQSLLTSEVKARVSDTHATKNEFAALLCESLADLQNTVREVFAETYNTHVKHVDAHVNDFEVQVQQICKIFDSPSEHSTVAAARRRDSGQCTLNTSLESNISSDTASNEAASSMQQTEVLATMAPAELAGYVANATDEVARKVTLVERDVSNFESLQMNDSLALVDGQHRKILQRLRHAKQASQQCLQEGVPEHLDFLAQIRSELSAHAETTSESLNRFGNYLLNELALFAQAIQDEASLRENMDDHLVTVLNEWNKTLQKGLVQAVNVE